MSIDYNPENIKLAKNLRKNATPQENHGRGLALQGFYFLYTNFQTYDIINKTYGGTHL